jgi:ribosomal protein L32
MLNFYPPFLCRVLAAILKMADILKILKMQNCSSNGDLSLCHNLCLYQSFQICGKGGQSHIFGGSKGVGVTIESYGKLEISYINVDNF